MSHEYRVKQLRAAIRLPGNSQKSYKFFCRGLDIRVAQIVNPYALYPCGFCAPVHLVMEIALCYRENAVFLL